MGTKTPADETVSSHFLSVCRTQNKTDHKCFSVSVVNIQTKMFCCYFYFSENVPYVTQTLRQSELHTVVMVSAVVNLLQLLNTVQKHKMASPNRVPWSFFFCFDLYTVLSY